MSQSPNKRFVLCMIVYVLGVLVLAGISQHLPQPFARIVLPFWMFIFPVAAFISR